MNLIESLDQWAALQGIGKKPRTQDYYRETVATIRRRWPPRPDMDPKLIAEQDLKTFAIAIAGLSATRFNMILTALQAVAPAAKCLRRRTVEVKERPILSQLEFSRLLNELDKRPRSHGGLVIRFLAHTGLRINEARRLKWGDVRETFILAPGRNAKNGRPRLIPFVNGIRGVLDELKRTGKKREAILPQSECKRALKTACVRAGVPRLSHHDFRHLFATRCIQSGVDLPTVARWLGHKDGGALLAKTYYHLADEHSLAMAAKVRL